MTSLRILPPYFGLINVHLFQPKFASEFEEWIKDHDIKVELRETYVPMGYEGELIIRHLEVYLDFQDPDQAMLFKLTWM